MVVRGGGPPGRGGMGGPSFRGGPGRGGFRKMGNFLSYPFFEILLEVM